MLTALLKFGFAGGIIFWMVNSGKLDFSLFQKSVEAGPNIFYALLLMISCILITCFRWKFLIEAKSEKKIGIKSLLPIHWIGLFFSTFLPGVVTGDVVKLLYVRDLNPRLTKTFLLTSVIVDRVIGLCGLLTLSGLISAFKYNELVALSPKLATLINFNFLLFAGAIFFMVCIWLKQSIQIKVLNLIKLFPLIGHKVAHLFEQVWVFGTNKSLILKCWLISITTQFLGITVIWLIASPFFTKPVELTHLFGLLPIGIITISIPISPSGAGVGHYIFDELFGLVGISGGANFFNMYFLCLLFVNLLGAIPYLLYGKKHSINEVEHFEEVID